jgi:single-strand DNA-binding protein
MAPTFALEVSTAHPAVHTDRRSAPASAAARHDALMTNSGAPAEHGADNQVFLRGRLADAADYRELPSGDVLAVFRLTVTRPPGDRVRVDSLECASTRARVHRTLDRAEPGDELEVSGCLRRRFWRGATGPASRYSVDAVSVRLNRAGRRAVASPGRKPASE